MPMQITPENRRARSQQRMAKSVAPYRAVTFGDPARPVAMEPGDIAALDAEDDQVRADLRP
jgi:hypothetical protein